MGCQMGRGQAVVRPQARMTGTDELLNPYSVGGSLGDPRGFGFFGREDVFEFVLQSLQTVRRAPVVLYGQRRIGKSSVLRQLPRHLPRGTVSVFFDLQGQAALPLDTVLYGLAREIAPACGLTRPGREEIDSDSFPEFLQRAYAALGSPRRLVLLFDEFDVVDGGAATNAAESTFLGYLAKLIDMDPQLGIVMVIGRKVSELSEEFVGAILRNAVQHRLVRLTRPQSDALAVQLGANALAFDEAALSKLYAWAAGHPYCTQLLCNVLWQRRIRNAVSLPVAVTQVDVEAAVAPAIEYGTSGLNWIYDGLDAPAHRLFLAALAELQGEHHGRSASMSEIEKRLFSQGAPIDAMELRTSPARLANWDVVDGTSAGYRFAVPMVGVWIRANRPLVELEAQARLANPRAWRLYELAVTSQEAGQQAEAIDLYEQAVSANPALIEGFLGLGVHYRLRGKPGDLDKAIAAFERALDLDPAGPRTGLLEALVEKIERSGHDDDALVKAFRRIVELDADSAEAAHARRRLDHLARIRMPIPDRHAEAERLFEALDDKEGLRAIEDARTTLAPRRTVEGVAALVVLLGFSLAPLLLIDPIAKHWPASDASLLWLRRGFVAAGVGAFPVLVKVLTVRSISLLALISLACAAVTLIASAFDINLLLCAFGGFVLAALLTETLLPGPKPSDELASPSLESKDDPPMASLALRAASWLQRYALRVEEKER